MQPSQTKNEPLDVLIVGMGFSGIGAAIKLLESDINNMQSTRNQMVLVVPGMKISIQVQLVMCHHIYIAIHLLLIQIGLMFTLDKPKLRRI